MQIWQRQLEIYQLLHRLGKLLSSQKHILNFIALSYQWNKIVSYIVYKGPSYNNKNEKNTDVTMGDEICA